MTRIIREAEVRRMTGISRTTMWRLEKQGLFPSRRSIGANSVGWLESEISEWIETRPRVNPATEILDAVTAV